MNVRKRTDGFAMIEVLLAIVVLAIAMLAGSRMQILGMNYSQGAQTRSTASMAVNDIVDRMRTNPAGVTALNYDGATTANLPANPNCAAIGCTPAQLAQLDLASWGDYFAPGNILSQAVGTISAADANNVRTITVSWADQIAGQVEANGGNICAGGAPNRTDDRFCDWINYTRWCRNGLFRQQSLCNNQ